MTAIACYNDWIAMLTIDALTKRGIRVPEDFAERGWLRQYFYYVALSAVHHIGRLRPVQGKWGRRAVRLLMKRIEGSRRAFDGCCACHFVGRSDCTARESRGKVIKENRHENI